MVSDKGQAPRPTTETIHSNGSDVFTGAEHKLYARCCERIRRRMNTEQFISQNVRTPRRQAHLSWDSCFRPGDPEEPVTCTVAQVSHFLSQTSSHYIMVAFTGSELPPSASASPRTVRGRGIPFVSLPIGRCCVSQALLRFLPSKTILDIRYHLCEAWTESQTGISLHHCGNGAEASRRKVMMRKENRHILPQELTSLFPSLLVKQK